jgi:ferredoxin
MGRRVVKLTIHADRCTGHGRCYTLAPGLLTYDDEGYVTIRGQVVDVPSEHRAAAQNAATSCPEQAVEILHD